MDIEEMKKSIDEYFDTHSPRDIVETMYRPFIEHMKTFDRAMWEEAIDRELSLGDEQCWYSEDPEVNKFKDLWNIFNTHIDERIPWICVENADFPTRYFGVVHNGKTSIVTLMIGQGIAMDIVPLDGFLKWMKRNKWKVRIPDKTLTLDELEKAAKDTIADLEDRIQIASDKVEK